MRKLFAFVLCMFLAFMTTISAQDSSLIVTKLNIPNTELVLLDRFRNIYVATNEPRLLQYDSKGTKMAEYTEVRYGSFTVIDINNPLSILVYYADFGIVQILDRNLTLQSEFNLRTFGYLTNTAIGLGADNNIWFYNMETFRLIKIDSFGKIIRKSNELTGLVGKSAFTGQIWEQDNFLLMRAPDFGWMLFDDFGSYIQTLPLPDEEIQYFTNSRIYYRQEDYIDVLDLNNMRVKSYPIPTFLDQANNIQYIYKCWMEITADTIRIFTLD